METNLTELEQAKSRIISADKAANLIGVSRSTLLRYRKNGTLNCVRVGGRIYYKVDDVKNFLTGGGQ